MSAKYLTRNPDGTGWKGHYDYDLRSFRRSRFDVFEEENVVIEQLYELYGVCQAFSISLENHRFVSDNNHIYTFLYGKSIEDLMTEKENSIMKSFPEYVNDDPQVWTKEMVNSMNWDMFCISYYRFVHSSVGIHNEYWKSLKSILLILRENPEVLESLIVNNRGINDKEAIVDFWKIVYKGLKIRTLGYLKEDTCYIAFEMLRNFEELFTEVEFIPFAERCCNFLDQVAKERIMNLNFHDFSRNWSEFSPEYIFFYDKYFEYPYASSEVRSFVNEYIFFELVKMADMIAPQNVIYANRIYLNASNYALKDEEIEILREKRENIFDELVIAEANKRNVEAAQRKIYEKRRAKEELKERIEKIMIPVLGTALILGVLGTVVFGLLYLLGIFQNFSKMGLNISLIVLVPLILLMAMDALINKFF